MNAKIETAEYKLLCQAVLDACRELRHGSMETGRQYLLVGLERASDYAESGTCWGDVLADEYRRALREYDQLSDAYLVHTRDLARIQDLVKSHAIRSR